MTNSNYKMITLPRSLCQSKLSKFSVIFHEWRVGDRHRYECGSTQNENGFPNGMIWMTKFTTDLQIRKLMLLRIVHDPHSSQRYATVKFCMRIHILQFTPHAALQPIDKSTDRRTDRRSATTQATPGKYLIPFYTSCWRY